MFKVKKAIIMAAGKGTRLRPVTLNVPKPLIRVNGTRMIDSIIEGLISNEINDIYVVVGYLKDKFKVLIDEYKYSKTPEGKDVSLKLIENPYFEDCNNISSLYVARAYLGECVIIDGDQILKEKKILAPEVECSGYCSSWSEKYTSEWAQYLDEEGYVIKCQRNGGDKCWRLHGVSFWSKQDGEKLEYYIEQEFLKKGNTKLYWDDIAMFTHKDKFKLAIRKISNEDIVEIDNLDELIEIDNRYMEMSDE